MILSPSHGAVLMTLARRTIRNLLAEFDDPIETPSGPALLLPAGCFVSLHEQNTNRLRGCVGRLDARDAMYLAVIDAARSVLGDPRFEQDRITLEDLPR